MFGGKDIDIERLTAATAVVDADDPHARSVLRLAAAALRATLLWGGVTTLVGTVVFGAVYGVAGAAGAAVGGAVAVVAALMTLWLMWVTARLGPQTVLLASLGGFAVKMMVLLVVMMSLRGVSALRPNALAITMIVGILVTAGAETMAFRRTRIPTVIPEKGDRAE
jgi:hypothetical protein